MLLTLCASSACWIIYAQQYLLLFPKFKCDGIEDGTPEYKKYCIPHYFCKNDLHAEKGERVVNWSVVKDSNITLTNLMTKHDLICASKAVISSFGMSYFAGYASGSMILPALSDKYGRKKFLGGAILTQSIAALGMLFFPKGYASAVVACFFFIGCCSAIRVPSAMCLMYDSAPKKYHGLMNSVFFVLEILTFVY